MRVSSALLAMLLLASCRSTPPPAGVARVAVLPFENLSGDSSLDWFADAAPHVIVWQQAAARDLFVAQARNNSAALELGAQRLLRATIERAPGGQIRLDAWLEDRATRRSDLQSYRLRPDSTLFAALHQIAATLGAPPRPYATKSVDALRALIQSRTAEPAAARERLDAALAADSAYSVAHLARMESAFARRDLPALREALTAFREKIPSPGPGEAAEANQLEAAVSGDIAAVARSLQALAASRPANAALQRQAAAQASRFLSPAVAADAWQRLLRIEPNNTDGLRMLAYAKAAGGDFAGARQLLDRYRAVAPDDVNTLDSHGEIEYQAGHFAEAAAIFARIPPTGATDAEGQQLIQAAPFKAAYAFLLAGDEKAAHASFEQGLVRRKLAGVVATATRASWLFQTGQRPQAFALLSGKGDEPAPAKAILAAQACLLHAAAGHWERAHSAAAQAQGQPLGIFCGFLSQPPATETEWHARAAQRFPGPALASFRQRALGYALALRGHCPAAIAPLRAAVQDVNLQDNTEARLLLGRCYFELQQWPQMRETLTPPPVPPTYEALFSPLVFPWQLQLRADVERHFERLTEAQRWDALHRRLQGRP